jgi:hypothetical protein
MRISRIVLLAAALVSTPAGAAVASEPGVRVLHEDATGITLVFRTPATSWREAQGRHGYMAAEAEGLGMLAEPDLPRLAFGHVVIGVPEGTRAVLASVHATTAKMRSLRAEVSRPSLFGEDPDSLGITESPLPRGAWPERVAEIASTGWMRDMQVAEIRFYPYRSMGRQGGLLMHSEIEVRIAFEEDLSARPMRRAPSVTGRHGDWGWYRRLQAGAVINPGRVLPALESGGPGGAAEGMISPQAGMLAPQMGAPLVEPLKIPVKESGLYGIAPADLSAAGLNPATVDPRDFRVEFLGVPISVEVTGESDGVFDPTDRIIFYGEAATGRLTRANVYWLHFDGAPSRVTSRDGTFGTAAPTPSSFETTLHEEVDAIYTAAVPGGAIDRWWWVRQATGDPLTEDVTYPITVPNVDPAAHTINLRFNLQGRTSVTHHTRLFLNGPLVDDKTWGGIIPFDHSVALSSSTISSGSNSVRLFVVGDFSVADQAYSNFIEMTYRRTYDATSDHLLATGEGPGDFRFSFNGFGDAGILLYDVTDPAAIERITVPVGQITGGGPFSIAFQESLTADRSYAAATGPGLRTPAGIVQEVASNLAADPNGADWIVITPPDPNFISALQPLVTQRQAQGYRVLVATTEDIYDEFNFGILDTDAIEAFLDNAWATYPGAPPEYLVLAGDTHIDFLDNFGSGVPLLVPAKLQIFSTIGEAPSDNEYVTTAGGDFLPEMIVGRLPVRTASELTTMVSKILAYENSPPAATLNAKSLFVADNGDSAFEAVLNSFAGLIPPSMIAQKVYLSQTGSTGMRAGIKAGLEGGALMTTYIGHGSATQWTDECGWAAGTVAPCFMNDPATLADNGNVSFVAALNCINGYFTDLAAAGPGHIDFSLAEAMVRRPSGGAIAMWAPVALANLSDYSSIGDWLFREVFLNGEYILGRATFMAVTSAVTQPFSPAAIDNVRQLTFFGDPATVMALDSDGDGLLDRDEAIAGSDPYDRDSDDDGLSDLAEASGTVDPDGDGIPNGLDPDSDNDGISDGTEAGLTTAGPGTLIGAGFFVPDADPLTTTDPFDADSDGGGAADGAEDRDFNGAVDPGETDPTAGQGGDDLICTGPLPELVDLTLAVSSSDLLLSWEDFESSHPCMIYRVYAAPDGPYPKDSRGSFGLLAVTGSASLTHVGAAIDGMNYDYLVVAFDPLTGEGPLGHYGQ